MDSTEKSREGLLQRLKGYLPYLLIVILFGVIATAYFMPATMDGRMLFQQDVAGVAGNGQDVRDHEAQTGEHSYWTNGLFGGMPMYQISPSYPSTEVLSKAERLYALRWPMKIMGDSPWMLFAMMLGFFLLLKAFKVRSLPATLGAIMWTFSSYFIILIAAGHIWKLTALAFIPPTIAGLVWIYRGKWIGGGFIFAFFTALQLLANHVQMSYYFFFVMLALVIGWLVEAIRTRTLPHFLKSSLVALAAGLIGIAVNATNLYHTYSYAKYTMRGGSELTLEPNAPAVSTGLDKEYITQWSYGVGETWSLLVPNIRGGASVPLGKNPELLEGVEPMYRDVLSGVGAYWGEQPFTSGPVYVGAFVLVLFLLGCFIVRGPVKWALLVTTLLSILLSWGKNFMPLTDFFIDYVPMYANFRAVSSILVIAEFTIPLLAILALVEVLQRPSILVERRWVSLFALGFPVLMVVLFATLPDLFFDFLSSMEREQFGQLILSNPQYVGLRDALIMVRRNMLRTDALLSLLVLLSSGMALFFFAKGKLRRVPMLLILGVITLVDLWHVDKRYLHDDMFQRPMEISALSAPKSAADEVILNDKTLGFRVWNQSVNSFNDATTTRWHRSIGGYHAAKLQRYQDLITYQLAKGNRQVVNMLNTRYVIQRDPKTGIEQAYQNPEAFGPAWFVSTTKVVPDANSEMRALDTEDLRTTAVIDARFDSDALRSLTSSVDSTATITLTKHTPNEVIYKSISTVPSVAVFSEIYYPEGWHATIDGKEASILRANYVLRALIIPEGTHEVRFSFAPTTIVTTERIAFCALILLLLLFVAAVTVPFIARKKEFEVSKQS